MNRLVRAVASIDIEEWTLIGLAAFVVYLAVTL